MVKLCALLLLFCFTPGYGFISFDDIRPGDLEERIRVEESQVRPKSGKGKNGAITGKFFGRTIISRDPASSEQVEIHEFQHQPRSGELAHKDGQTTVGPAPETRQARKSRHATDERGSLTPSERLSTAELPPEERLGIAGALQGARPKRNLGSLGSNLLRLEKIADNPPGAAEMKKAEMEQAAAAARARASPPPSRPEPAPVRSSAPPGGDDDREEVMEAAYSSTPAPENNVFEEPEQKPSESLSSGLEPYAMYTDIPSYASRYRRSFSSVGQVGLQFASKDEPTGGAQEVPASLPIGTLPSRSGVLDIYGGPLPKAESQMPLESSFAPAAGIASGGEAASSFQQPVPAANVLPASQSFEPASVPQDYAPGVKSGFDILPYIPESFTVAPGASDIHNLEGTAVRAPDSYLPAPPSSRGADVPSMKYGSYLPPSPLPEDSYGSPVRQSSRVASSYSGDLPSSVSGSEGIDHGLKNAASYGLQNEAKAVDEMGRWKRSIGSIARVGMQFSGKERVKGGASALPSSGPLGPLPLQRGAVDTYDRPLPRPESQMSLEGSFAAPEDISVDRETGSGFREPAPATEPLSGFEDFKPAAVSQDSVPGASSDSTVSPALLLLFLVDDPGASQVQSPDKPAVRAPESELSGPPSAQGAGAPTLNYGGQLPPAPAPVPEDSYEFPAHQSGSLASSYSEDVPSSAPMGEGVAGGFKDSSMYGAGDEIQSIGEAGRWKRSLASIPSVGMQFVSRQKPAGDLGDLSSSVPVGSMPVQGGILDSFSGPLPKAHSEMPLKDAFAPRGHISSEGELAGAFQQPVPVSSALRGFGDFKPAPVPDEYGPDARPGFDFLPAVPQSFSAGPGASDVHKLDQALVSAPNSQLSGPPSSKGPEVPPMKYQNYVPPPPTLEDSLSFPVHQSGRLASPYSGHLPSSMPEAGSMREDYSAPLVDQVSSEEATSHSMRFELIK